MSRAGTFFLLLGVLLCALFLMSDIAGLRNYGILLAGAAGIAIGLLMKLSQPSEEAPPSAARFRLIREIRNPKPKAPREKKPLFTLKWGKPKTVAPAAKPSDKSSAPPSAPQGQQAGKKQDDKKKQPQKK